MRSSTGDLGPLVRVLTVVPAPGMSSIWRQAGAMGREPCASPTGPGNLRRRTPSANGLNSADGHRCR